MKLLIFPLWLVFTIIKNAYFKIKNGEIVKEIKESLKRNSVSAKVSASLGLGDWSIYSISIICDTNMELDKLRSMIPEVDMNVSTNKRLSQKWQWWPINRTDVVTYHSYEEILKAGGYYHYFK